MIGLGASLLWGSALGLGGAFKTLAKGSVTGGAKRVLGAALGTGLRVTKGALSSMYTAGKAGLGALGPQRAAHASLLGGLTRMGVKYGVAAGFDSLRSEYGDQMSPFTNSMLGLSSSLLRLSGIRSGLRGAAGSLYTGAARGALALGKRELAHDLTSRYNRVDTLLGGVFTPGSLFEKAAGVVGSAAGFVGKIPARVAVGSAYALKTGAQMLGRVAGLGSAPIHGILNPTMTGVFGTKVGNPIIKALAGQHGAAPIGHGVFALSALGGMAAQAASFDAGAGGNWSGDSREAGYGPNLPVFGQPLTGMAPAFNPADYAGIQPAMKAHAPMISNLTLGLHRNNNRVMP